MSSGELRKVGQAGFLALLLSNPIVIAVVLIILGGVFVFFSVWFAINGLLTAAIFFVAGLGLVFIVSTKAPDVIKSHPLVFLFTPIGLGIFGLLTDKVPGLGVYSLTDDVMANASAIGVGILFLIGALVFLAVARKSKKHKHR